MKILFYKNLLLLFALITSCTKVVESFDIRDPEPKIVVSGLANADSFPKFFVIRNISLNEPVRNYPIKKAALLLYKDEKYVTDLTGNEDGWFQAQELVYEEGNQYRIEVEVEGYKSVSASFYVPDKPVVYKVDTQTVRVLGDGFGIKKLKERLEFGIEFENTPEVDEYFAVMIKAYSWWTQYKVYGKEYREYLPEFDDYPPGSIIYDSTVSGSRYLNFTSENSHIETLTGENDNASYFDVGLARTPIGRISCFSDEGLSAGKNRLVFSVDKPEYYDDVDLYFISMDENQYEFARSMEKYEQAKDGFLVEPVNVFTNVNNGFGLVSGWSVYEKKIILRSKWK